MTPEERQQLKELIEFKKQLENSFSIPRNVQTAFQTRLGGIALNTSAKTVASETQAVDEAGSSTYDVPKIHDGFVQTTHPTSGATIYIPYYT